MAFWSEQRKEKQSSSCSNSRHHVDTSISHDRPVHNHLIHFRVWNSVEYCYIFLFRLGQEPIHTCSCHMRNGLCTRVASLSSLRSINSCPTSSRSIVKCYTCFSIHSFCDGPQWTNWNASNACQEQENMMECYDLRYYYSMVRLSTLTGTRWGLARAPYLKLSGWHLTNSRK